ncbi:ABC transporter ATP-binding protein [Rhizobium laguerreae]|uniref:ABC transporter ATP-binding protein n=1 Tax=Rhizobium laguerreae TaxID=1076926 RepID=UPI001C902AA4|nr:ABC transporter ATP-binding protein [Rhizobium laguerreae]MBY3257964.1 ABC transporter ATP-binding protein [Rhizobium laguerreae]MBY3285950.1 ABC transporter ATP-binding protein [Rhizobium laguerreae]MBY3292613.1 ABC transporter ATP-binding protein [Rhizobium laguerreae]
MAPHPGKLKRATKAVHVRDLARRFATKTILDGVDLDIEEGEFVALLGRSGSGKSTFLRALAGLDHGVEGTGTLETPESLSVVFQDARLLPWRTVIQNVTLGLTGASGQEAGRKALAEVGLAGRETAWPNQLSGGEQQRVALARSLVREPALLLADEPFGALDALTRLKMHDLLRELCARHRPAVLLVTHDVDEAISLADRILVLDEGRLIEDLKIDLPAPRDHGDPRFAQFRIRLLSRLGVELPGRKAA